MRRLILLFFAVFVLISETNDVFAQPLTKEEIFSRHFACLANGGEATPQPIIAPIQDGSSPRPEVRPQQENCVQQYSISRTKRSMFLSPADAMAREKRAQLDQERDLAISRTEENRLEKIEIERRKRWRNIIELIDPQERDALKRSGHLYT